MNSVYNLDLSKEVTNHFENVLSTLSTDDKTNAINDAKAILAGLKEDTVQPYVLERITHLENMIAMIADKRWLLSDEDQRYILSALTYFSKEDDVIPDDIPVVGLLDDCIVIDIVVDKIKARLTAYGEFKLSQKVYAHGNDYSLSDWNLDKKREKVSRLRNRRNRNKSSRRTRGSSFSIC